MDKNPEYHFHFDVRFRRSHAAALGAVLLVGLAALKLDSETLTMSTTYPSPSGIYHSMVVTGGTTLARDNIPGSQVVVGAGATTLDRAGNITAAGSVSAGGNLSAAGNATVNNVVWANNGMTGWNYVTSNGNMWAGGTVTGQTAVTTGGNIWAQGSITAQYGDIYVGGNINTNDVWLRDVGRWASAGGGTLNTFNGYADWFRISYPGDGWNWKQCPNGWVAVGMFVTMSDTWGLHCQIMQSH